MGKYSKVYCARWFSDSSQTSQIFLYDVLVHIILCCTSTCTVEKAGINFKITNEKMPLFISMLILTGYYKLSDHRMYREMTPDAFV